MRECNSVVRFVRPAFFAISCISTAPVLTVGCQKDNRIPLREFLDQQVQVQETQTTKAKEMTPAPTLDEFFGPYKVGPGDVVQLTLTATQTPPFPPTLFRVNRDGTIMLPVVGPVQVGNRELEDVETAVRQAYVPAVFSEAVVHVELARPETTDVVVKGAVSLPGFVKLRRTERNLLHAIVGAGGLSQAAGGQATLRRVRNPAETVTFDLTDPVQVNQALAIAPLENGDIISVHSAQLNTVYVGGLVNRPAPLVLPPGVQLTALQAVAGASGLRTDVTPTDGTLIRRLPDGTDAHIKLDLGRMARGEEPNITLAAGDILWVPDTLGTRVQDFINRNIFMRAGVSVTYSVTGIEFMNRRELQGSGVSGNDLENTFDPLGFLGRDQLLQDINSRPLVP